MNKIIIKHKKELSYEKWIEDIKRTCQIQIGVQGECQWRGGLECWVESVEAHHATKWTWIASKLDGGGQCYPTL